MDSFFDICYCLDLLTLLFKYVYIILQIHKTLKNKTL